MRKRVRVEALRAERRMSLADLVVAVRIEPVRLRTIERGSPPTEAERNRLAAALGVSRWEVSDSIVDEDGQEWLDF